MIRLQEPYDPVAVSDLELCFPAEIMHLLPTWDDIPIEFRTLHCPRWEYRFWDDSFNWGVQNVAVFSKRRDIDTFEMAWRHLQCIIRSYQPAHEHKLAALAYLTSLWYTKITWECAASAPRSVS